jgi:hypothetical protein
MKSAQSYSQSFESSRSPNKIIKVNPSYTSENYAATIQDQTGSQFQLENKQTQSQPEPKGLPSSQSFSSHLSGWDSPPTSPERISNKLPHYRQDVNEERNRERVDSGGLEDWDEEFQLSASPPIINSGIEPQTLPMLQTLTIASPEPDRPSYSPPILQQGVNPYRTFSHLSARKSSSSTSTSTPSPNTGEEKNRTRGGLMARVHSLHKRFSSPGVPTRKDFGNGETGVGIGMGRRMNSIGSMLDRVEGLPGPESREQGREEMEDVPPVSPASVSTGRLPTSPSLVSVGFHLPSPSPASPYNTGRANETGTFPDLSVERDTQGDEALEHTPRRARIRSGKKDLTLDLEKARDFSGSSTVTRGTVGTMGTIGSSLTEDARMDAFRMTSPVDREGQLEAMGLPTPMNKRKSTLKRLSSMGKKHGRKVSDGWRLVSGTAQGGGNGQTVVVEKKRSGGSVPTPKTAPVSFSQYQRERITPPPPLPSPMRGSVRLAPPLDITVPVGSMRSMSHRTHVPSPSASRISSDPQATRSSSIVPKEEGSRSPSSAGLRRVSLSDLKIPSRVASTQKGLKEGIQAVKQFAGCVAGKRSFLLHDRVRRLIFDITDLKALVAQRAIIESNPACQSGKEEYARWWDQAHVLIQLGETGSTTETPPQTPMRERRITLIGDPKEPVITETANGNSVGKKEFSEKEVDILRDILQSPGLEDRRVKPANTIPDPPISPLSPTRTFNRPSDRRLSKPSTMADNKPLPPKTKQSSMRMKENLPILPPLQIPNLNKDMPPSMSKQRRASRSGFFNLRDMWRTSGKLSPTSAKFSTASSRSMKPPRGSESSEEKREMKKEVVRSPVRPGLASLFRRSSGEGEIKAMKRKSSSSVLFGNVKADKEGKKGVAGGRSSIASSISDWDNFEAQISGGGVTPKEAEGEGDKDRTIGRSDSRRMLANLGINPESSPRRNRSITGGKPTWNSGIGRGDNSPTLPSAEGMKSADIRPTLVLTPDNLVPLLNQARTTIKMCQESLENSRTAGRA